MSVAASTLNEKPVSFLSGEDDLFGILTYPTRTPNGTGVLLLWGGAARLVPSVGRNRFMVRVARHLASRGYHSMRMDYHGAGESAGDDAVYRLDHPFVEDAVAAIHCMRDEGLSRFLLFGTCFGARTALAASAHVPGLQGVALFPTPVRDFQRGERLASLPLSWLLRRALHERGLIGLLNPRIHERNVRMVRRKARKALQRTRLRVGGRPVDRFSWVSPNFLDHLEALVRRGVPVLMLFGEHDDFLADFNQGRPGRLDRLLEQAGELITLAVVPGRVHGLATLQVQDDVSAAIDDWLTRVEAAQVSAAPGAGPV